MTPAARVQAGIEMLDAVIEAARRNGAAADTVIAEGFRARRYAGGGDRRWIREFVYRAIRRFGEIPPSGRAAAVALADDDAWLRAAFDGSRYGPPVIETGEERAASAAMPAWLGSLIPTEEHGALLGRAPLDLRANTLKTTRDAVLGQLPEGRAIGITPNGIRFAQPFAIENDPLWRDGHVEVQDAGSQLVALVCAAQPGMTVIDLCAGGGGKTLALAADIAGEGRLVACDTDRNRLSRLAPRAGRAGARVEVRLLDGGNELAELTDLAGMADVVLVDAPCTGSGTLRRNPEARWRITPERLNKAVVTQRHVLDLAVPLVKPGGALVYAVCSLIADEGMAQVEAFRKRHDGWHVASARTLTPSRDRTDGFFLARLESPC